jgi:hypothetical protein
MSQGRLPVGVRRLGLAVLMQALRDAEGRGDVAQQARGWLTVETPMLRFWCAVAGVEPRQVQQAARLATRGALRSRLQAVQHAETDDEQDRGDAGSARPDVDAA